MSRHVRGMTNSLFAVFVAVALTTACTGRKAPPEPPAPEANSGVQVVPTPNPKTLSSP